MPRGLSNSRSTLDGKRKRAQSKEVRCPRPRLRPPRSWDGKGGFNQKIETHTGGGGVSTPLSSAGDNPPAPPSPFLTILEKGRAGPDILLGPDPPLRGRVPDCDTATCWGGSTRVRSPRKARHPVCISAFVEVLGAFCFALNMGVGRER